MEGIRKRHSKGCATRSDGRCNCNAGWEASIYLAREGKRITKTFPRESEAKSWRVDAMREVERGTLRATPRDGRSLAVALGEFVRGMESGAIRPKGREGYKPNTVRSYERALRGRIAKAPLARVKVAELQRRDLQRFADDLLASGLSASTVSNIINPIQAFYRWEINRDELTQPFRAD